MEERRLERQRRESAKTSAASTLPSTQDKEFNLRLIELYGQHPCLWKTSLGNYENVELKREAWQQISSELGAHLTPSFVRSRISSLRYRLNVFKLQIIEYKMSPASSRHPEKPYFIDQFAFLDEANSTQQQQQQEEEEEEEEQLQQQSDDLAAKKSSLSIASIFKQRMQQQQKCDQLPNVLQRLSESDRDRDRAGGGGVKESSSGSQELEGSSDYSIASVMRTRMQQVTPLTLPKIPESLLSARRMLQETQLYKKQAEKSPDVASMLEQRMHRLALAEQDQELPVSSFDSTSDVRGALGNIPSVVKKRMRQQLSLALPLGQKQEKISSPISYPKMPETATQSTLRAMPGDSVSKTIVNKQPDQPKPVDADEAMSDEEEFYRLHWSIRQQQRSRRPTMSNSNRDLVPQPVPSLLLGLALDTAHNTKKYS